MKYKSLIILSIICFAALTSCSQNDTPVEKIKEEEPAEKVNLKKSEPHRYGGWYCPDNLNGFPAVDISNWREVPVVNGRMATKEETQNGTSLIHVDIEKYPEAKPLDMKMPRLARYYSHSSQKEELIIIIQALNISNDSIVGFRFLNGGNGSARLSEVKLLTDLDVGRISPTRFVSHTIEISATQAAIWEVLTKAEYSKALQVIFDKENKLEANWNTESKVNFKYSNAGAITSEFADNLYGSQYIQIDCEQEETQYVEKFLLLENEETKRTELKILCGPYGDDFESQKTILTNWARKVKDLSEAG